MSACLFLLGVLLGCAAPEARGTSVAPVAAVPGVPLMVQDTAPRVDAWLAEDKLRHFTMSFAATAMLYGGSRVVLDRSAALGVAAAGGIGLGIGKEVVDARSGRWFSVKDLVWDAAGVGVGILLAEQIRP